MNEFARSLREQLEDIDINIAKLSRDSGIERTLLHKIIKGDRKPANRKIATRILDAMMLTESEKSNLMVSYEMSKHGKNIYLRDKSVTKLIEGFTESIEDSNNQIKIKTSFEIDGIDGLCTIRGKDNVFWTVRSIIEDALGNEVNELNLIMQTENRLFMNLFYNIQKINPNVKVNHILCFEKNIGSNSTNTYNLNSIHNIVPFLLNRESYTFLIYYDDIASKFSEMTEFPNLIIVGKYAITLSNKGDVAMIYSQPEAVEVHNNFFKKMEATTKPLINRFRDTFDFILYYYEKEKNNKFVTYDLMDQPCLVWFLTDSIIRKYLVSEIENREAIINIMNDRILRYRKYIDEGHVPRILFTLSGLERFINEGTFDEIDSDVYLPLSENDRVVVLKNLLKYFQDKKFEGKIIDDKKLKLNKNLIISISSDNDVSVIYNRENSKAIFFKINESSIASSISSFVERLDNSDYVDGNIDIIQYLENRVAVIQQDLSN